MILLDVELYWDGLKWFSGTFSREDLCHFSQANLLGMVVPRVMYLLGMVVCQLRLDDGLPGGLMVGSKAIQFIAGIIHKFLPSGKPRVADRPQGFCVDWPAGFWVFPSSQCHLPEHLAMTWFLGLGMRDSIFTRIEINVDGLHLSSS